MGPFGRHVMAYTHACGRGLQAASACVTGTRHGVFRTRRRERPVTVSAPTRLLSKALASWLARGTRSFRAQAVTYVFVRPSSSVCPWRTRHGSSHSHASTTNCLAAGVSRSGKDLKFLRRARRACFCPMQRLAPTAFTYLRRGVSAVGPRQTGGTCIALLRLMSIAEPNERRL